MTILGNRREMIACRRDDAGTRLFSTSCGEDVVVFDRSIAGFRSARHAIDEVLGEDYVFGNLFSEMNRGYEGDHVLFQWYIRWWDWSQRDVFLFKDGRLARIGTMTEKWLDGSSARFNMNIFSIRDGDIEFERPNMPDFIMSMMLYDYMSGYPPEYDSDMLMADSVGARCKSEFKAWACSPDARRRIVAAASCEYDRDGNGDGGKSNANFIRMLAKDLDWRVRRALAGNFWVDAGLVEPLLDDHDWRVRQALCRIDGDDKGQRAGLLARLVKDPEYEVRALAAAEIAGNMFLEEYSILAGDVLDSQYDDDFKPDFAMLAVSDRFS